MVTNGRRLFSRLWEECIKYFSTPKNGSRGGGILLLFKWRIRRVQTKLSLIFSRLVELNKIWTAFNSVIPFMNWTELNEVKILNDKRWTAKSKRKLSSVHSKEGSLMSKKWTLKNEVFYFVLSLQYFVLLFMVKKYFWTERIFWTELERSRMVN